MLHRNRLTINVGDRSRRTILSGCLCNICFTAIIISFACGGTEWHNLRSACESLAYGSALVITKAMCNSIVGTVNIPSRQRERALRQNSKYELLRILLVLVIFQLGGKGARCFFSIIGGHSTLYVYVIFASIDICHIANQIKLIENCILLKYFYNSPINGTFLIGALLICTFNVVVGVETILVNVNDWYVFRQVGGGRSNFADIWRVGVIIPSFTILR